MAAENDQTIIQRVAGSLQNEGDFETLLDYVLERGYLPAVSSIERFSPPAARRPQPQWVKIERLPIKPSQVEDSSLQLRWQSVLSSIYSWNHRLIFSLFRCQGRTSLYAGLIPQEEFFDRKDAAIQFCQAATSQMSGIALRPLNHDESVDQITIPLSRLRFSGAVTGVPSWRKGLPGYIQTLDHLSFGIRDFSGDDKDYTLTVIADPIPDNMIADMIRRLRQENSEIHSYVTQMFSQTAGQQTQYSEKYEGTFSEDLARRLLRLVPRGLSTARSLLSHYGGEHIQESVGSTRAVSFSGQRVNKAAEYCEQVINRHIERLQQGRANGFWNTGVYILAETDTAARTVTGNLRSLYSGNESYLEPIRVHHFPVDSGADRYVKAFQHIPFPLQAEGAEKGTTWRHPLGPAYETITTQINTDELSLTTSLPRRDVPGLRTVVNQVRFNPNPPTVIDAASSIEIGEVIDNGVSLHTPYAFDVNSLVRHAFVTGLPGSGKTTTCLRLMKEVRSRGIPVLVIEPAKEEYVSWAIDYNAHAAEEQRIRIFMPGAEHYNGVTLEPLRLNPFEPATADGKSVDYASRAERLAAVLSLSLPMADVLPVLLDEIVNRYMEAHIGVDFAEKQLAAGATYPRLEGMIALARRVIEGRGYEQRVQQNLTAALETRIGALTRGKRGQVFNVQKSTPWSQLFENAAVVNLSRIADNRDKALIMALITMVLYEYRVSRYRSDPQYKQKAAANKLCHLTIIEEAHRLLRNPERDYAGVGSPQAVVTSMFSDLLSEIRAYGQGLLIVDQIPSRLIPDVIKNTNCKIVHRLVARDERTAMAGCMALRPDQEDLIAVLQVGEAIICGDQDDAAAWVKIAKA